MKKLNTYFVELTDTFGGEANYAWRKCFKVKASTMRGACNKISREIGNGWKCVSNYGDMKRYDSRSGLRCYFIEDYDPQIHDRNSCIEL